MNGVMRLVRIFGHNTLHHKIELRIAELKCDVGKKNAFFGGDHRQHEEQLDRIVKDEGDEGSCFFFSGGGFKLSSPFSERISDSWVHAHTASRFELEHIQQHA